MSNSIINISLQINSISLDSKLCDPCQIQSFDPRAKKHRKAKEAQRNTKINSQITDSDKNLLGENINYEYKYLLGRLYEKLRRNSSFKEISENESRSLKLPVPIINKGRKQIWQNFHVIFKL